MSGQPVTEVIEPSKTLAEKAVRGAGPSLETILARSEKSVAALNEDYSAIMKSEFKRLQQTAVELSTASGAERLSALKDIYARCHDLRGLAGTFDYPLVTVIGSSLCNLIDKLGARSFNHIDVIVTHIGAMTAVVKAKATDDGGKIGQQLVRDLSNLVDKTLENPA